jgi:hypothetical protein
VEDQNTPGPDECPSGYTRDDLRYLLFMKEAGAVADPDAEEVARHLEKDSCAWCSRETEFLYWTEPGFTTEGRQRYQELMSGLEIETEGEERQDTLASAEEVSGDETLNIPIEPEQSVQPAAIPGAHARSAVSSIRQALSEQTGATMEQRCLNIVETIIDCFPPGLSEAESQETAKRIAPACRKSWRSLHSNVRQRADKMLLGSGSGGAVSLRKFAEGDDQLMFAVVLHVASVIPGAKPLPLSVVNEEILFNPEQYQSGLKARFAAPMPQHM